MNKPEVKEDEQDSRDTEPEDLDFCDICREDFWQK